jgi:hypothetical protein
MNDEARDAENQTKLGESVQMALDSGYADWTQIAPDDYPPAYFAPSRLLAPENHPWPVIEE